MYLIRFRLVFAVYACICVQALNILVLSGHTIQNSYVQFFTLQSQAWIIVASCIFNFPHFVNVKRNKGDQKSWRRLGLRKTSCLRTKSGDKQAGEKLYVLIKPALYTFLYRFNRDEQLSIDLVQDTFLALET